MAFAQWSQEKLKTATFLPARHMLTVDLPGQGLTPNSGLFFEARMERPLQAASDYTTREQGGEAHCQVDNRAHPDSVLFD